MSTSILRRNSSKKSLQNIVRLTTQWSVEDEEEAARERRRRERERQQQTGGDEPSEENLSEETFTDNHASLKPSGPWENDEDEGFSDWSQRLEQRKLRGACQVPTDENEEPRTMEGVEPQGTRESGEQASDDARVPDQRVEEEEDEEASRSEVTEVNDEPDPRTYESYSPEPSPQEVPISSSQLSARNYEEVEEKPEAQEATVGYSERDQEGGTWETPKQEVHALPSDRWEEEEENRRRLSVSSNGEECDETIATTVKVTEIAENLNRSIQKSNSIKKSEPPLPISKIDDRLEQYTHAIETSAKPARLVRQPSLELIAPGDAVSNKKNRWETGEVTTAAKMAPCKDTEGINIGVSDLINQWGKGKCEPDGAQSPPRPLEVKPGDVLSKKSLWEQGPKSRESDKNTSNKKYKFVSTGHGKYEKILVDEP
ncbi:lymphocyte-specific protein 1 isoform X2 [Pelobates fuscus]|uniref:lymphocyte-specific protein 1 isoform X2 n=1 Tax=Pelobates fuscus TaxID=191477 RepID=UPI002FE4556B